MAYKDPIGKIEKVSLRTAFPHEAQNFTVWLEQNIDALAEPLGLELTVLEREKTVGSFQVDLLCEDGNGVPAIVENQLERTDHDHLGKLLTYMVNLDARIAIWVTPEARLEHARTIDWLNEHAGANYSFYLVQVEAIRIGESPFAPLFTPLIAPDEQIREIGETKKEWADRDHQRFNFWSDLLERSQAMDIQMFSKISPSRYHWIGTGAGKSGITFNYNLGKDWSNAELYIDHDRDTGQLNKAFFDALYDQKDDIEAEFGEPLIWQRLDDKRACRISKTFLEGGLDAPERWPEIQTDMIETMSRLENIFRHRLANLEV